MEPAAAPVPAALDLASMTKAELLAYAEETGAAGVSGSMTKANIIKALEG